MRETLGCAIAEARSPDGEIRWDYTTGLIGQGLPELAVFGLPRDMSIVLLVGLVQGSAADEVVLHPCDRSIWTSPFGEVHLRPLGHAERYLPRADAWEGFTEQEWMFGSEVQLQRVYALQLVLEMAPDGFNGPAGPIYIGANLPTLGRPT